MSALGIPHAEIVNLIRHNDRPIGVTTLTRKFKRELAEGGVKLKARMGNLMIATIEGREIPNIVSIKDDRVRGSLLDLFLRSRMGFKPTTAHELANPTDPKTGEPVPFVYVANKTDSQL